MKKYQILIMSLAFLLLSSMSVFAAFVVPSLAGDSTLGQAGEAVAALVIAFVLMKMVIRIIRGADEAWENHKYNDETWEEHEASKGRDANGNFVSEGTFIGPTGPDETDADDRRNYN